MTPARDAHPPFAGLIDTADHPAPPGGRSGLIEVARAGVPGLSRRPVLVRWALWRPALSTRGTVCVFQGRTEFIEKYYETIEDLLARGFTVATMDWRGQGGSSRARRAPESSSGSSSKSSSERSSKHEPPSSGHVSGFDDYITDLSVFMRRVVYPLCPGPHFALSHSMSGPVMLLAAARRRPFWFDRMVLCAPMLRLPLGPLGPKGLRALSGAATLAGLGRMPLKSVPARSGGASDFEGNCLTSDPERHARAQALIDAVPGLTVGPPTLGWLNAAARAMDACFDLRLPRRIDVPILFAGAACDKVVSTPAIEELALRLRSGSCVLIPGARHEILMERDDLRDQFWAAFDAFIPGGD